jgi:hypothetical protein
MGHGGSADSSVPPSDANQRFDQLAGQIAQLAREHGQAVDTVERALKQGADAQQTHELQEEAKRRAGALRDSVGGLPPPGQTPGTRRAAEALLREHASAMAHALDKLSLEEAVESGRDAAEALNEALRRPGGSSTTDEELEAMRNQLQGTLEWAHRQLKQQRTRAEQRAGSALREAGEREGELAQRAQTLAEQGRGQEAPLPEELAQRLEEAQKLMDQAARALSEEQGKRGLELQNEAQRLLDRSDTGRTTDSGGKQEQRSSERDSAGRRGDGERIATGGEVPDEQSDEGAQDFRERVLRGLGKEKSDRLAPAVQRYAEELLQ